MVYHFVSKIKNVKDTDVLDVEALTALVDEIDTDFEKNLEFKFILPTEGNLDEVLVKSQVSVSSMPAFHDKELEIAVKSFTHYIEELAVTIRGEVRRKDGFYNNNKIFRRLFVEY